MYYAINGNLNKDGDWIILKAWEGCYMGQGKFIKEKLTYKKMRKLLNKLENKV